MSFIAPAHPDDRELKDLLSRAKTIAVVGLSPKAERDSNDVARYLQNAGYRIVPVNPAADEILGEKAYPDLVSIPEEVDIVDVFRRSEFVPDIARQAAEIGASLLWLQLGVRHDEAAFDAYKKGLAVVQDSCLKVVHRRLFT